MADSNVEEIIDFAIEEENKAEKLYSSTAEKTGNNQLKSLLSEMADMEKGHAARLEAFKKGKIEKMGKIDVQDLKIGDYLVEVEINEASSIQDIMIFAIKAEMKARELYINLGKLHNEPEEKELFENLANEELKHKNDLEKAYDDEIYKEN